MAVTVRLTRVGGKHKPYYRVVVADERAPRDGRFLELVGTYDPMTNPAQISLKRDRIEHWISKGARTSKTVSELLGKSVKDS